MSDPYRSPADIDAAKANLEQARKENSEQSIIAGYFAGGEIVIDSNLDVIFGPFMADVLGQKVSRSQDTNLSDFTWRVARINKQYYHLYLNKGNLLFVDLQEPDLMNTQYGLYHPVTRERYVGTVYVDENGLYTQVISHKRVRIEDLDVQTLSSSEAFIDLLSASMINADVVVIGFTGEDITDPQEGDRRVYIDGDEIGFEEYTDGAYTTVNSIKLGGVDSNSIFAPFLACRGILNSQATIPSAEFFPSSEFKVYNFENNYEDQDGLDEWTSKVNTVLTTAESKFGAYSLFASAGAIGAAGKTSRGTIGTNQSGCAFVKPTSFNASQTAVSVVTYGDANNVVNMWIYSDTGEVGFSIQKGGGSVTAVATGLFVTINEWNLVGFSYNSSNDEMTLVVNEEKYSQDTFTGTWGSGLFDYVLRATNNTLSGYTIYVDEAIEAPNLYINPDVFIQHYIHNVAWNTDYSAKDIALIPASGGVVNVPEPAVFQKGLKVPFLHIQDQKTSGTASGTFTAGAWRTRILNTAVTNTITGASLSSNQITLPAGDYYIESSAPVFIVAAHILRLQNITDTSTDLNGTGEYADVGNNVQNRAFMSGRITITGTKAFELQHRCGSTKAANGFGVETGGSFTVDHEVYADIRIWQLA